MSNVEFSVSANLSQASGSVSSFLRQLQQLGGAANAIRGVRIVNPRDFADANEQLKRIVGTFQDFRRINFGEVGGSAGDYGARVQRNLDAYLQNNPFRRGAIDEQLSQGAMPHRLDFGRVFPNQSGAALAASINQYQQALLAGTGLSGPQAQYERHEQGDRQGGGLGGMLLGSAKFALGMAGVGTVAGSVSQALSGADQTREEADTLLRHLNTFGRGIDDLIAKFPRLGDGLAITQAESIKLADVFSRTARTADQEDIFTGARTAAGMARAYGEDPAQTTATWGRLRFLGATGKSKSDENEFATKLAGAIYQGGMQGNSPIVMHDLASYLQSAIERSGSARTSGIDAFLAERANQYQDPALAANGMSVMDRIQASIQNPGGGLAGQSLMLKAFGPYVGYNMGKYQRLMELGLFDDVGDILPEHKGKGLNKLKILRDTLPKLVPEYANDPGGDLRSADLAHVFGLPMGTFELLFNKNNSAKLDDRVSKALQSAGVKWGDISSGSHSLLVQAGNTDDPQELRRLGLLALNATPKGQQEAYKADLDRSAKQGLDEYRSVVMRGLAATGREKTPASEQAEHLKDIKTILENDIGKPIQQIRDFLTKTVDEGLNAIKSGFDALLRGFGFKSDKPDGQDAKFQGVLAPRKDVYDLVQSVLPADVGARLNDGEGHSEVERTLEYAKVYDQIKQARAGLQDDESRAQFDALISARVNARIGVDPAKDNKIAEVFASHNKVPTDLPAIVGQPGKRIDEARWVREYADTGKISDIAFSRESEDGKNPIYKPNTEKEDVPRASSGSSGISPESILGGSRKYALEDLPVPTADTKPDSGAWAQNKPAVERLFDRSAYDDFGLSRWMSTDRFKQLYMGMVRQESSGNSDAMSPAGARGLMQITPDTAMRPGFGLQPIAKNRADAINALADPETNARFGQRYFAALLQHFDGDEKKALAAYNAGVGNVESGKAEHFSETREYVPQVLRNAAIEAESAPKQEANTNAKPPGEKLSGELRVIIEHQSGGSTIRTEERLVSLSSGANQASMPGVVSIRQPDPVAWEDSERGLWTSRAAMVGSAA